MRVRVVGAVVGAVVVASLLALATMRAEHDLSVSAATAAAPPHYRGAPSVATARQRPAVTLPQAPVEVAPVKVAPVKVAPLGTLRVPDLQVTLPGELTRDQDAALRALPGMTAVAVLDLATVRIGTAAVHLAGVDPSQVRAFTPRETASSDPLWASVARGELASSYSLAKTQKLPLGGQVSLARPVRADRRLGAVAVLGLPGIEVVTDRATARALGAAPARVLLLTAPSASTAGLQAAARAVLGPAAQFQVLRAPALKTGRPKSYRELYIASAAYCPGLKWEVLAAIGQIESGHGRDVGPSSAGALGPMQFLPSTWASYGVDGDGDGKADIMNAFDAVPAAALYLCRNGAGGGGQGLYDAVYAYNHADWYVKEVLALAARYR